MMREGTNIPQSQKQRFLAVMQPGSSGICRRMPQRDSSYS
jgi:hypothetical protein